MVIRAVPRRPVPILAERITRGTSAGLPVIHKNVTLGEGQRHLEAAAHGAEATASDTRFSVAAPISRSTCRDGWRLTYPDYGSSTVQDLRPHEILRVCRDVCTTLRARGLMWLDCAPKNIVRTGSPHRPYVLVDFDHGLVARSRSTSADVLIRCIQLAEEFSPLRRALYPCWPSDHLLPDAIRAMSGRPGFAAVEIGSLPSRRVQYLADLLRLPDPLADHQYLRLFEILGSLAAGTRDLDLLSAWDHVAISPDGTRLRATVSLLAHYAHSHGASEQLRTLDDLVKATARDVYAADGPAAVSAHLATTRLKPVAERLAQQIAGCGWRGVLADHGLAAVLDPDHSPAPQSLVLA